MVGCFLALVRLRQNAVGFRTLKQFVPRKQGGTICSPERWSV